MIGMVLLYTFDTQSSFISSCRPHTNAVAQNKTEMKAKRSANDEFDNWRVDPSLDYLTHMMGIVWPYIIDTWNLEPNEFHIRFSNDCFDLLH